MKIDMSFALFVAVFNESVSFQRHVFQAAQGVSGLVSSVQEIVKESKDNKIAAIKGVRELSTKYSESDFREAFPALDLRYSEGHSYLGLAAAKKLVESVKFY